MRILLVRPRYGNLSTLANPIQTEPLDLEYLSAVAQAENADVSIFDGAIEKTRLIQKVKSFQPDVVAITGYITVQDTILDYAKEIKAYRSDIMVMVGGVHAEVNYSNFQVPAIDLIVISGGYATFRSLVQHNFEDYDTIPGISFRNENGWKINSPEFPIALPELHPDRSHFYQNKHKFHYHYYGPAALVKSAMGCPYACNFCFCRLLNDGHYTARSISEVVDEIKTIDHDLIWIVDDDFLLDRKRIREFIDLNLEAELDKQYIIYGRADFIAENPDLMLELKSIGVIDIIVGFETLTDADLATYEKNVSSVQNEACAAILKEVGIQCTALFIVPLDATPKTLRTLGNWIKKTQLDLFTLSIFTPFPGTDIYAEYDDQYLTSDPRHWDLLHLVLKPTRMGRWRFYFEFYKIYFQLLLTNVRIRSFLIRSIFKQVNHE